MSNFVARQVAIKGMAFSIVFLLAFAVITFFGVRELVLFYKEPVSVEELKNSFADNTRVKLTRYRVAGVFDTPGYSYFILEYQDGEYVLFESRKDGSIYRRINSQSSYRITENEYVIEGYMHRLKDYQLEGVRNALSERGIDASQTDRIGRYAVTIVVKDYFMAIFGLVIMLLTVISYKISRWLYINNRD